MSMKPQFVLGPLPMSEKFSDLTLKCQGREFKVHKSVVCVQSSVIATACDRPFKESQTNVIEIDNFDVNTVERMVHYLYYKRYTINIDDYRQEVGDDDDDDDEKPKASIKTKSDLGTDLPEGSGDAVDGTLDAQPAHVVDLKLEESDALVLLHVHVNGIADYYDIPGLKDMANRHIKRILAKSWTPETFTAIVEEAFNSTGDQNLHEIIAECAATHITDLAKKDDFFKSGAIVAFPAAIIKTMAETYPKAVAKLEESLATAQNEAKYLQKQLDELQDRVRMLMDYTQRIRRCRNVDCRQEMSGFLDEYHGEYTWRCSQCRCKHPSPNYKPSQRH